MDGAPRAAGRGRMMNQPATDPGGIMRLSTRTYGSGPRRIGLVHGLGADGALWKGLTDRIVALGDTTVVTVDLAGHGESPRSDSYTIDAFADGVVDALPVSLEVVAGHSLGGAVLERAIARLRPSRGVYLDPGLALALPTTGAKGRLFWAVAPLALTLVAVARLAAEARRHRHSQRNQKHRRQRRIGDRHVNPLIAVAIVGLGLRERHRRGHLLALRLFHLPAGHLR